MICIISNTKIFEPNLECHSEQHQRDIVELKEIDQTRKQNGRRETQECVIGRQQVSVSGFLPVQGRFLGEQEGDINLARFANLLDEDHRKEKNYVKSFPVVAIPEDHSHGFLHVFPTERNS